MFKVFADRLHGQLIPVWTGFPPPFLLLTMNTSLTFREGIQLLFPSVNSSIEFLVVTAVINETWLLIWKITTTKLGNAQTKRRRRLRSRSRTAPPNRWNDFIWIFVVTGARSMQSACKSGPPRSTNHHQDWPAGMQMPAAVAGSAQWESHE